MASITFDRSLYLPEAVDAAAAAYAEYADIAVERSSDAVTAIVGAVRNADRATIEHSFCNLVLQETVVRRRRTGGPDVAGDAAGAPPEPLEGSSE